CMTVFHRDWLVEPVLAGPGMTQSGLLLVAAQLVGRDIPVGDVLHVEFVAEHGRKLSLWGSGADTA
ncbi:hypothetical protein, partial [Candidatus Frankia alpina]|uniref:hypothetical protein n=1 Tax=Candidatus Frankia alpina TaxID=2699483 RepID=UPI0019686008